jgi:Trypsin-like peptidase domain
MSQLEDLLQQCTVKLSISGYMGWGTGFFVAPELILTCAHVVEKASIEDPIQVRWKNEEKWAQAFIERLLPNPYDLALLRVSQLGSRTHPCISFDREKIRSRDQLYLFGYPANDFPNGCPVTCDSEGLTMDEPSFIKFKAGKIQPGMSGSPLLNQRTGDVCGIVKFTLGSNSDAGGGATQSTTILAQFPELIEKQMLFHQQDWRWNNLVGELFDDEKVMIQNNSDDTTGYQTKTGANNTNYIGGVHHHNSDSLKVEQANCKSVSQCKA